jgi:Fe(3+) dicitrate transport protein
VARAGIRWSKDKQYKLSLTGVAVASQYWQDSDQPSGTGATFIPAEIPKYKVLDFSAEYFLSQRISLLGGVSNLTNKNYYSRVFSGIEPANRRATYIGATLYF